MYWGFCDRNMKFVYVLPGWEGSSSDSRVLRDAMTRRDPFVIPHGIQLFIYILCVISIGFTFEVLIYFLFVGKYYLVDAGYTNGPGFLAPYRSTRYHLNEWMLSDSNPTNYKELFNLRHSSARNVIERTFGLFKKRWAILRTTSWFDTKTQV